MGQSSARTRNCQSLGQEVRGCRGPEQCKGMKRSVFGSGGQRLSWARAVQGHETVSLWVRRSEVVVGQSSARARNCQSLGQEVRGCRGPEQCKGMKQSVFGK